MCHGVMESQRNNRVHVVERIELIPRRRRQRFLLSFATESIRNKVFKRRIFSLENSFFSVFIPIRTRCYLA